MQIICTRRTCRQDADQHIVRMQTCARKGGDETINMEVQALFVRVVRRNGMLGYLSQLLQPSR